MALTWGQVAYIIVCVTTTTTNFEPDQVFFVLINYLCISYVLFVDIFTRSFDDFILMKFPIAVFFPASPFITFGDFCQLPRLLHPPRLLFWSNSASLTVYSTLPFYLKLDSSVGAYNSILRNMRLFCVLWKNIASYNFILRDLIRRNIISHDVI